MIDSKEMNMCYEKFTRHFARLVKPLTLIITAAALAAAQGTAPAPSPSPAESRFEVKSSVEVGARGLEVNGSESKFRSDLNYGPGFRLFDSSFLIEDKGENGKLFDSFLFTSSGWDGDPTSFVRTRIDKTGFYRFDSNYRRVKFFNSLNNHALNQHNADYRHQFGDFDLTIFPESENLRLRFGYSFNDTDGDGSITARAYSDEFPVKSFVKNNSNDFRAGVEGKVLGFNLLFSQGYRKFDDKTTYLLEEPNLGNNPTNNARFTTFQRTMPVKGDSYFSTFSAQRTFAEKFDFVGRFIYSSTDTDFILNEVITGRDNSNNQVDSDTFRVAGDSKRPQARGDVGVTWLATDKLRISNLFTYDRFNIVGGNLFAEALISRTAGGVPRADQLTNTLASRVTTLERIVNLVEADYQINDRVAFNIGYRRTNRDTVHVEFDRNFAESEAEEEIVEFDNDTDTVIAGMRIKPFKNSVVYWDVEHGRADNVFTRLANKKFTNFRVRSRTSMNKFALNLSFITKDNINPGRSEEEPDREFAADVNSRTFSGSFDWTPNDRLTISSGYTYQRVTSSTAIIVPISNVRLEGISQYFVRDHYAFFDITARPFHRLSIYASYRIDNDQGQGDRFSTRAQDFITSYPLQFQMPEVRIVAHLTKNIDWNIGYQYYDYQERFQSAQDYRAHLTYTSLRIYFGRGKADRY